MFLFQIIWLVEVDFQLHTKAQNYESVFLFAKKVISYLFTDISMMSVEAMNKLLTSLTAQLIVWYRNVFNMYFFNSCK